MRYRVAALSELPPGKSKEFVIAGRIVAVFHLEDGQLHAMDGVCPHAGGPLGEGMLRKNVVTCPWHGWQFDVTTGQHCLNARIQHQTYPLTVDGDEVFVEFPTN